MNREEELADRVEEQKRYIKLLEEAVEDRDKKLVEMAKKMEDAQQSIEDDKLLKGFDDLEIEKEQWLEERKYNKFKKWSNATNSKSSSSSEDEDDDIDLGGLEMDEKT